MATIKETGEYDNFMSEMTDEDSHEHTLESFLGKIEAVADSHPNHWKKHWKGMPEYENESATDKFKTVYVHFRTKEDFEEFCNLIDQHPRVDSKTTTSIWYPKLDRTANSLLRWMEVED